MTQERTDEPLETQAPAPPSLRVLAEQQHLEHDGTERAGESPPTALPVVPYVVPNGEGLDYELASSLPGRLRLKVPRLRFDRGDFEHRLMAAATAINGVTSARTNRLAASLVIEYDRQATDQAQVLTCLNATDLSQVLASLPKHHPGSLVNAIDKLLLWIERSLTPVLQLSVSASALAAAMFELPLAVPLACLSGLPILCRATQTAVKEKRISVDGLDGMAALMMMLHRQLKAATFMMTLIGLGEFIRELTASRCQKIVDNLLGLQGASAWLVKGHKRICIPAEQVQAGDVVVVYPGDMIPVDGQVFQGEGMVNQAGLTGESAPAEVREGSPVYAATVLTQGQIYLTCQSPLAQSRAQQVVEMVNAAPLSETKIENYAARVADKAVVPIIGSAVASFALTRNVTRMMSILIYDYSTGIRISAPTAVLASMAHAGKLGILVKSGGALERLSKVNAIVFDKTGTLTTGNPQVTRVEVLNGYSADELVSLSAAVENRLSHPAAQAIVKYAAQKHLSVPHRSGASHSVGMGVAATVDGKRIMAGSRRLMETKKVDLKAAEPFEKAATASGESLVYVAINGVLSGLIGYADSLRPEAADAIKKLHRRGVKKIIMATGDVEASARRIAALVGVDDVLAGAFPENKANLVKELKQQGYTVAVVGDGINDSPALAHADVPISLKGATHAAREYADVVLTDDNLLRVVEGIDIARGAMGLIKQTMALVAVPNTLGLVFTAFGTLGPASATLLNNGSAIVAAMNSLRPLMAPGWSRQPVELRKPKRRS